LFIGILEFLFGGLGTTIFIVALMKRTLPTMRAMRLGARADGVITANKTQQIQWPPRQLVRPVVVFTDQHGRRVQYLDLVTSEGSRRVGQDVTVYYDPADPEHTATIGSRDDAVRFVWIASGMIVLFGLVCVSGMLMMLGVWH
jgi:hypothetical protein